MPEPSRPSRFLLLLTFERGLIVALVLVGLGVAGFAWSLYSWALVDFGVLEYARVLRVLIVSLVSLAIGVQLGFVVFLSGIMNIPLRRDQILSAIDEGAEEFRSRVG